MKAVLDALNSAREQLAGLNGDIAALEAKRAAIVQAPPHTDDMIQAFHRGLDAAASLFEHRLSDYLNDQNAIRPGAAEQTEAASPQLLTMPVLRAAPNETSLFLDGTLGFGGLPLDVAAVTFFLQDQIAAEIPVLVQRLCPAGEKGMRRADRVLALAAVDADLAVRRGERDELLSSLEAAQSAAAPDHGVSKETRELDAVVVQVDELARERSELRARLSNARMNDPRAPATGLLSDEVERLDRRLSELADRRDRLRSA